MTITLDAVFENGLLRPLEHLHLPNGVKVRIVVEQPVDCGADEILNLARRVYQDLTEEEIDAIEQLATNREGFFAGRTD